VQFEFNYTLWQHKKMLYLMCYKIYDNQFGHYFWVQPTCRMSPFCARCKLGRFLLCHLTKDQIFLYGTKRSQSISSVPLRGHREAGTNYCGPNLLRIFLSQFYHYLSIVQINSFIPSNPM